MKLCFRCGDTKPVSDFGKNRAKADGLQTQCVSCRKLTNNESYHRTKGKHNEKRKERAIAFRRANQEFALSYLKAHPCVDCGEADPVVLQFDHQRDKVADVAVMIQSWSLPKLIAEIEKCQVVCANCHIRRTARQFGWWKAAVAELV